MSIAVDYVGYMLDICEKIIVISSVDIRCDDALVNPFQDSANTYVQLQERHTRPNETVTITKLKKNQSSYSVPECDEKCTNFCQQHLIAYYHERQRHCYSYHLCEAIEITKKFS
ncbi:unnamed protein product [Didymodactylos carnosus]|uniref:Uncharacterized protein n=1 Tax=Didymodactylos carnosus TaxID=1234261 RepID=A0A814VHU2_9BILA|nr:unnamed protein product [Didymodactylos carnosus]CAF3952571.1 unnamed protein product [Didymodactylos carnosus]